MRREDPLWLNIFDEEASCVVQQTFRLQSLTRTLEAPYEQAPSLVLFFESPEHRYFPQQEDAGVYLRLDPDTANEASPLLLASTQSILSHSASRRRHKHTHCSIAESRCFPKAEALTVLPRLMLPFVDVMCFICINLSDVLAIETQVEQWTLACGEHMTGVSMPAVAVLLGATFPLQPSTMQSRLTKRFPTVTISAVRMGELTTWATSGMRPLRKSLRCATTRARRWKASNRVIFSAIHLTALVRESLIVAAAKKRPFHYIEASRSAHPVAPDLSQHLFAFAKMLPRDMNPNFMAESVAASFFLDHFTPGMHGS